MTLVTSLLLAYLLWKMMKIAAILLGGRRSTIHLEDGSGSGATNNDNNIRYDETVVLFGPMNSGKTTMMHQLLLLHNNVGNTVSTSECVTELLPMTVTSIAPNTIYLPDKSDGIVRIIDYPGHNHINNMNNQFTSSLLQSNQVSRMVFTVDSTSSITQAANMLYTLLNHSLLRNNHNHNTTKPLNDDNNDTRLQVLIACTKQDQRGSKNYKRIKLQLRNEMERLRNVDDIMGSEKNGIPSNDGGRNGGGMNKKGIDLDHLEGVKLHFVEVALLGRKLSEGGMNAVREFVLNGAIP